MRNFNLKKTVIVCFAFALILAMVLGSTAVAEKAQLRSTQNFLDFLDSKGIKYTYAGMTDDGDREIVRVGYTLDNYPSLDCNLFFKNDCEEVSLRIWNIVTTTAGKNHVLSTLNSLNAAYKFVKFVLDESDSTVQAEIDIYIDGDHCGRSVYDAMMAAFNVTDNDDAAAQLHALE